MKYREERLKWEDLRQQTKEQKRVVHKTFTKSMKRYIIPMDILIITMLLMNFGVVVMTNALVVRDNPDLVLQEANQVQSDLNDYKQHPDGADFMKALMIQSVMWAVLLTFYIYSRMHMYRHQDFWFTLFIVMFYFYLIYWDFFNDFGFFIGKIIWGG